MKHTTPSHFRNIILTLSLPIFLASCGDSHEKAAESMLSVMNRLGDTLSTVTDKSSAEAAKDKIQGLVDEMKAIKTRMEKLGKPSAEADAKLKGKYEKEMGEATKKMMGAAMKLSAAGPEAQEALKSVMEQMKDIK